MAKQAFEGARRSIYMVPPEDVIIIGVDTKDGPEHPLYDERIHWKLKEPTILDIMGRGVKEPIVVKKDGDKAIVTDGRRRVLHAREANKRLKKKGREVLCVPVMPPENGSDSELLGLMVSLNEHREEDSVFNRARKIKKYLDYGHDEADAARTFNISVATVHNYLGILSLDKTVQKAVAKGNVSASAALELADLPQEEQRAALDKLVNGANGKATAKEARAEANKRNKNGTTKVLLPPRRLLGKLVDARDGWDPEIDPGFMAGVMFCTGRLKADEIDGLPELLKGLGAK